MNTPYKTSPYKFISSAVKDAYNFCHSQTRINIKFVFGMLMNRWTVPRTPIPLNMSIKKYTWYVFDDVCTLG